MKRKKTMPEDRLRALEKLAEALRRSSRRAAKTFAESGLFLPGPWTWPARRPIR